MRGVKVLVVAVAALALVGAMTISANAASDLPYALIVRIISTDHYQIEVQNGDPSSFIKSFAYTPPDGLTVTAVTGVKGGSCSLTDGTMSCSGKIVPPSCSTCIGASMVVNFTATGLEPTYADGYYTYYGVLGGVAITGTIPVEKPTFSDLPLCGKGKTSTKAHPCAKA